MGGDNYDEHVKDWKMYHSSLLNRVVNFESQYDLADKDRRMYSRIMENGSRSIDFIGINQIKIECCKAFFMTTDVGSNRGFFWDNNLGEKVALLNQRAEVPTYKTGRVMRDGANDFLRKNKVPNYSSLVMRGLCSDFYDFVGDRFDEEFGTG